MILNPPTAEGLNDAALSLHFSTWQTLVSIITDFQENFESESLPNEPESMWADEWVEYVTAAQSDIRPVLTLLQQSNELALKARLCSVSAFLLLIGADTRFKSSAKDLEFDDLPTLNAVELPGAVNTLTPTPISEKFLTKYTELRKTRNKIMHLGLATVEFDPFDLLHDLIAIYCELWSDRAWLQDRLAFGGRGASVFFDDGRHWSIAAGVMLEWDFAAALMTGAEFKRLFGFAKSKRRYVCLNCFENATTKWSDYNFSEIGTAHLSSKTELFCLMCQSEYSVKRRSCPSSSCKGNVVAVAGQGYDLRCHSCGYSIPD